MDILTNFKQSLKKYILEQNENKNFLYPVISVLLAFVAGGFMLLLLDINPLQIYKKMIIVSFTDPYNIAEILVKTTPLILSALSFAFAFRASLFNIGADGQFYLGALAAVFISLKFGFLTPWLLLPLALLGSMIIGGLWSGISGYLRAKYNASEIIVTIMLNYIAFQIVSFAVNGPLKEQGGSYPQTDPIPKNAYLPSLIADTRLHVGFLLALFLVGVFYFILNKTSLGFKVRSVGFNPQAAEYAGIKSKKVLITTMIISGAFAGVAGFIEINGVQHILIQGFSTNLGAVGTVIALLAYTNPIGIILGSLLFGFLEVSANIIKQTSQVPKSAIQMIQGFVVIFVLVANFAKYKVNQYREKQKLKQEGK